MSTKGKWFGLLMVLAILASGSGGAGEKRVIRFAANASLLTLKMCERFADSLEEKSKGTIQIERYLRGQLGTNDEHLSTGLIEGNYEILRASDMMSTWAMPEWLGYANVAFCFKDAEHVKAYWEFLDERLNERLIEEYGVRVFVKRVSVRSSRYLTANTPILKPADIKGLKFRTPNIEGVVASWQACGANITPVPFGELFGALQSGVVDAQENPAEQIKMLGLATVQKYLMKSNHQFGVNVIHVSDAWFRSLTPEEQGWVESSVLEAYDYYNAMNDGENEAFLKELADAGMTIIPTADIDIQAFKDIIIPAVLKKFAGKWADGGWDTIQALAK